MLNRTKIPGIIPPTGIISGTHTQRIIFGICFAAVAIYCDNFAASTQRMNIQMDLCAVLPFVFIFIQLRGALRRKRARIIFFSLFMLQLFLAYFERHELPVKSSMALSFGLLVETVFISFIFLRLCQSVDPQGPFGMTEAEKEHK